VIEPGVYTGVGNRDIDFLGKAIIVRSVNSLDPCTVAATVIDCEGAGRGFYFHNEEGESSVLAGLTMTGGYADYGGGIRSYSSSPTISNCIITENSASYRGGGIYCRDGEPIIRNCVMTGNTATHGAGISCDWGARPTITNCTISYNTAIQYGGGVFECDGPITGCTISGNHAGDSGGGLAGCYGKVNSCDISGNSANANGGGLWECGFLNNCIISGNWAGAEGGGIAQGYQLNSCMVVGNSAAQDGGGMYFCDDWSGISITNCTVAWNHAASGFGGGISFACSYTNGTVSNSVIWGNTDSNSTVASAQIYYDSLPEVAFSCIQDHDADDANIPFGGADNNNIDDYPAFVHDANDGGDGWGDDPCTPSVDEGANDDFGDLHLESDSPCINVGNPFSWIGPEGVDIDGQPRLMGGTIDMGADEFPYPRILLTKPQGGEVWVGESSHQITWLSEIYEGLVDILFSSNDGADWDAVETGAENTGSYAWHLPAVDSNECVIAVIPSVPDPNVNCFGSGLFTIHPDTPGPPVTSKWKSLAGDYDRLGRSENYGPELGCVKWEFEVDGAISASVTIGPNDTVYVPCEDGNLYKLDSNGVVLWSYEANSPLVSSPSIGPDGTVYVGSKDGKLYAVDVDGNLRWTHSTGGMVYSSPAVSADGNNIYVGSQEGRVYALGRDGSELWSFETAGFGVIDGSVFASPAIGTDGTVYIAGLYEPNLYALDPNNGSVKWVCNFEHLIDPYHPWEGTESGWLFASPVVGPNGTIYQVLLYDPNLYAIDPNDGSILWGTNLSDIVWEYYDYDYYPNRSYTRHFEPYYHEGVWCDIRPGLFRYENARYNVSDSGWSEPVIGPDGTIYVNFDDPWLRAVEPNGTIKWIRQIGGRSGYTETCGDWGCGWYSNGFGTMGFGLTVDSDGVIYAAGNDSNLYVINPDGLEIARFDGNDYWLGFPVISADNTIVFGDSRDNSMLISYQNNKLWAIGGDDCQEQDPNLYWQGGAQDLDNSGTMDFGDYAIVAQEWLRCTGCRRCPGCPRCYPDIHFLQGDINKDFYVDFGDVAVLADQWLMGH
jgi:outer membrane protein assembly factor BamB